MSTKQYGEDHLDGPDSIFQLVRRHDQDLYRGNGKPGVTTRLQQGEDRMTALEKRMESIDFKFWAIITLLIASMLAALGDIVFKGKDTQQAQNQNHQQSQLY